MVFLLCLSILFNVQFAEEILMCDVAVIRLVKSLQVEYRFIALDRCGTLVPHFLVQGVADEWNNAYPNRRNTSCLCG